MTQHVVQAKISFKEVVLLSAIAIACHHRSLCLSLPSDESLQLKLICGADLVRGHRHKRKTEALKNGEVLPIVVKKNSTQE